MAHPPGAVIAGLLAYLGGANASLPACVAGNGAGQFAHANYLAFVWQIASCCSPVDDLELVAWS